MHRVTFGNVYYWSDKGKSEIDFIVKGKGNEIYTIECKINPDKYSVKAIGKFRAYYPEDRNFCYSPQVRNPYKLKSKETEVMIL